MTRKKQILLLVMIHLVIALALWDGYRLGLKHGRAAHSVVRVISPDQFYVEPAPVPQPEPAPLPPERTDTNWRLN